MKILLTGHRGFIGGHIYRQLSQHDVQTYEWGDPWPRLAGLDWVIHVGAISSTTEKDVERVLSQNLDFSRDLLDACIELGINFQYASSASVYGLNRDCRETAPVDPRTPYAWSKYLFERYAQQVQSRADRKNCRVQGFRYFNVYGTGEEHKGSQASPYTQFRQQAERDGQIKVFRGSEAFWRDFVPVETVVDTHLRFFDVQESGVWNVGTGEVTSFYQVAASFAVPITEIDMPPHLIHSYQTYTCADLSKLRKSLGNVTK